MPNAIQALQEAISDDGTVDAYDLREAVQALTRYAGSDDPAAHYARGACSYLAAYLGLDFSV